MAKTPSHPVPALRACKRSTDDEDDHDDDDDTSLAARLRKIIKSVGTTPQLFQAPAAEQAPSHLPLTVTDKRLVLLSKKSGRMHWPEDLSAQVSPNGRGALTKKQLLQDLFVEYNGPCGRRFTHGFDAGYQIETLWLVDAKNKESRHMVVMHRSGNIAGAIFGDARADSMLLSTIVNKVAHQNAAPAITGAFTKGIRSFRDIDDMKAVLDLIKSTPPLRQFVSPEGYVVEERSDQQRYVAMIRHPNGKIVNVHRYTRPLTDDDLLKQMNKAFSQSRTATGADWQSPEAHRESWVKIQAPRPDVKQEPAEWSIAESSAYLFDVNGRPLSREDLRIDDKTPIIIDTCGWDINKSERYRQQLRKQMNDLLEAWEQGQLKSFYARIGVQVAPASYGSGVLTTKNIPAGTLVGLYGGMVFDAEAWEAQYQLQQDRDLHCNYLLEPQDKMLYIDSRERIFRNPMGFLNHPSRKAHANLKTMKCGDLIVGFVTTRKVECGKELTFQYGWHPHFTGTATKPHPLSGAD